jgi:hypothetical protein
MGTHLSLSMRSASGISKTGSNAAVLRSIKRKREKASRRANPAATKDSLAPTACNRPGRARTLDGRTRLANFRDADSRPTACLAHLHLNRPPPLRGLLTDSKRETRFRSAIRPHTRADRSMRRATLVRNRVLPVGIGRSGPIRILA